MAFHCIYLFFLLALIFEAVTIIYVIIKLYARISNKSWTSVTVIVEENVVVVHRGRCNNKVHYHFVSWCSHLRCRLQRFDWEQHSIHTIFKSDMTLQSHSVWPKDTVSPVKQDDVVYRILCECSRVYIGETGRPVWERIRQHDRDIWLVHTQISVDFWTHPQDRPRSDLERGQVYWSSSSLVHMYGWGSYPHKTSP